MSAPAQARTVEEIRATGAAWVTESELSRLCDAADRLAEAKQTEGNAILLYGQARADRDRYRLVLETLANDPEPSISELARTALDPKQQP